MLYQTIAEHFGIWLERASTGQLEGQGDYLVVYSCKGRCDSTFKAGPRPLLSPKLVTCPPSCGWISYAWFYLNATKTPWVKNWPLESQIIQELLPLVTNALPINAAKLGIFGHSIGMHDALTLALKYPDPFKSISAFALI